MGPAPRLASDGSPHPSRESATFGRDVRAMFAHIAGQYSGFDHLATMGQDLLWRPRALWWLDRQLSGPPTRILDVGCGPGDLTFQLARHFPSARITAFDFTSAMVKRGESVRRQAEARRRVSFGVADAMRLPFRSGTFDLVTSAFLLRNLPDLAQGLAEMARVLRPGGTCIALEVSEPIPPWFRELFHAYFDRVVPKLGALFRTEGPYRYLSESLRRFPSRERTLDVLRRAGFPRVLADPQSMGIVTTFLGQKPEVSGPGGATPRV
jgi:demethylmenaquinone methyltransferase / 2-methoxy-6-polyprenyl-1,4-benzoquinol methylase